MGTKLSFVFVFYSNGVMYVSICSVRPYVRREPSCKFCEHRSQGNLLLEKTSRCYASPYFGASSAESTYSSRELWEGEI
jgi:hypothetical protein